ncbi:hypothetical protein R1flu_011056 [Riccia fluitans]|uniref:ZZ-type domain-containing protein n=1 Tax=Riccia fluitans TaxID=41844 RepID=A0ABD1Z6R3_9MARC
MAYSGNIGQPWLHKGVKCAKCEVSPICGYRYKCKKRPDYDLCQSCFRREIPDPKIKYLKIERSKATGPYQVHFIECAECGVAPIKGKRYQHKTQEDCDLCEPCYLRATNPSSRRPQLESDYELFEDLIVNSVCRRYKQVFHFDKRCDECLISPICGPTFTSIKNPDYDLCAFCHDEKLQSDSIRQGDFVSRDKPDVSAVYHLNMICCMQCGMTPIKGPAFRHKRDPHKTLCLVCYYHVLEDKQGYFLRIDPPRQAEKGGPGFTLKPKASLQTQGSPVKATTSKTTNEAFVANVASPLKTAPSKSTSTEASVANVASSPSTVEAHSRRDHVATQEASATTSTDANDGEVVSRGHGDRSSLDSNGATLETASNDSNGGANTASPVFPGGRSSTVKSNGATTTWDSNEEGSGRGTSRGHARRSILHSSASDSNLFSDSDEDGAPTIPRKAGGSSISKPSMANTTMTSDLNEEVPGGATSRSYARNTLKTSASDSKLFSDSDEDAAPTVPRKYGGSSILKSSTGSPSTTSDSNEEGGATSRGYLNRGILRSSTSDPKLTSDSDEDAAPAMSRKYGGSSILQSSMTNTSTTSDLNEEGGAISRGYARRSFLKPSASDSKLTSDSDEDAAPMTSWKYGGSSILKPSVPNTSTSSELNEEGGAASRGYPGRTTVKPASDSMMTSDSDEDASTSSPGYGGRNILKPSMTNVKAASDPHEEGGATARGYPRRGILKPSSSDSMITSDSDEDTSTMPRGFGGRNIIRPSMASTSTVSGIEIVEIDPNEHTTGMASRGYGGGTRASMPSSVPPGRTPSPNMRRPPAEISGVPSIPPGRTPSPSMRTRPTTETNGTSSIPPGCTPSPNMWSSRITITEITGTSSVPPGRAPSPNFRNRAAGPPAPLYTAGLRTNRPQPASPRLNRSPPSSQPGQLQSALKVPSNNPSAPKPAMRVTFADDVAPPSDDSD